jgi:hypothetical protein
MRLVSLFSGALRIPHAAWVRFWAVDAAVASRLPSLEQYEEEMERAKEHNRQLTRRVYTEYAKTHILPRLSMGSGLIPMVQPRAAETESGL